MWTTYQESPIFLHAFSVQDIKSDILAENAKKTSQLTLTRNVTFGHQRNWLDPRSIQVASFGNPRAFVYRSFLSPVECDFLIVFCDIFPGTSWTFVDIHERTRKLNFWHLFMPYEKEYAKPSMHKSGVVDADSGSSTFSEIRTSTGSFIPSGQSQSRNYSCFRDISPSIMYQEWIKWWNSLKVA
jgi:hypothetical protein